MGSENLFHKRQPRNQKSLTRHQKDCAPAPRFLIVCEGTKTEPYYLKQLLLDKQIPPHLVKVKPSHGSSPKSVVECALKLFNEDSALGDSYDIVYCVFDRDSHTTFASAVERLRALTVEGRPFQAITSTPCFEYWLLLHFDSTDAPFQAAGNKSICDQVITLLKLKPGFDKYEKGDNGCYTKLQSKMDDAIKYAKQIRKQAAQTNQVTANPWTNVDEMVVKLLELSK